MIPKNINRKSIIKAIEKINIDGVPDNRKSKMYNLKYNGKLYPPKYTICVANEIITGKELSPSEFGGGKETNDFLEKLGFEITKSYDSNDEYSNKDDTLNIATIAIENYNNIVPNNEERIKYIKHILTQKNELDVILFPAGFLSIYKFNMSIITGICDSVAKVLEQLKCNSVVCFGIDCNYGADQLAIAVNRFGIVAMGRKFYPTREEKGNIKTASSFDGLEMGYPRKFRVKNKNVYLAVCYDCFGIRHCNINNVGIDVVLVLAHQFHKKGQGTSGDVDFARKGFAGLSQHWDCYVFGTAVFFGRQVPVNWQTGVLWTDRTKNVKQFKYKDNMISRKDIVKLDLCKEKALVGIYNI